MHVFRICFDTHLNPLNVSPFAEKNNVDLGVSIAGDLEELKNNLDKFKKSGLVTNCSSDTIVKSFRNKLG